MSKLRLTHYPQIPGPAFVCSVQTPEEGARLADMLADYDLFQFEHRIKPDYCNATLLEIWNEKGQEWMTWSREEDDAELDDLIEEMSLAEQTS